jgi:hypothetical protein
MGSTEHHGQSHPSTPLASRDVVDPEFVPFWILISIPLNSSTQLVDLSNPQRMRYRFALSSC